MIFTPQQFGTLVLSLHFLSMSLFITGHGAAFMQLNNVSSENWCDCSSMIIHGHNCMFMSGCYYQNHICWSCLFILLLPTMITDITILYCQNTVTTIINYSSDQSMWLYVVMTILNWKLLLHCFTSSKYYQSMKNVGNYFVLNINSTEYSQKKQNIYIYTVNEYEYLATRNNETKYILFSHVITNIASG